MSVVDGAKVAAGVVVNVAVSVRVGDNVGDAVNVTVAVFVAVRAVVADGIGVANANVGVAEGDKVLAGIRGASPAGVAVGLGVNVGVAVGVMGALDQLAWSSVAGLTVKRTNPVPSVFMT